MDANQHLTYNQQIPYLRPPCGRFHDPNSSPPSQQLADADLFATLLFDRQRAYQRTPGVLLAPYPSQPRAPDIQPGTQNSTAAGYNRPSRNTSHSGAMPPRTRAASERERSQASETPAKRNEKTAASKKPAATTSVAPPLKRRVRNSRLKSNLNKRHDETRLGNSSKHQGKQDVPENTDVITLSSDDEVDVKKESDVEQDQAQLIQQLFKQLDAAQARIKHLEDLLKTKQQQQQQQLVVRAQSTEAQTPPTALVKETQPTQNPAPTKEEEEKDVPITRQDLTATPPPPQPNPASSKGTTPPPTPHAPSTTDEEAKLENIRATYVRVRTKLNSVRAIVKALTMCTQSMEWRHYGEFGAHMQRLRAWRDEDEGQSPEQQLQR